MSNKKYELTEEICKHNGVKLHRIRALVDIPGVVAAGKLGGWIERDGNLSHNGRCWVSGNAKVYGNANVCDNARVRKNAKVYGNSKVLCDAIVSGNAVVSGDAEVSENAYVHDNAEVYGNARVHGNSNVYGTTRVYGKATVYGNAYIYSKSKVYDNARIAGYAVVAGNAIACGNCCIHGDARVYGNAEVGGRAKVCGDAEVYGGARVYGSTEVHGDARLVDGTLKISRDYATVGPVGPDNAFTTLNLVTGTVCDDCFRGTLDEFESTVMSAYETRGYAKEYKSIIAYFKMLINQIERKQYIMLQDNNTYTIVVHKGVSCPSDKLSEVVAGIKFPSEHHEAHIHREFDENGESVYVVDFVDTRALSGDKQTECR